MDVKEGLDLAEVLVHVNEGIAVWREREVASHKQRSVQDVAMDRLGGLIVTQEDDAVYDEQFTLPEIHHLTLRRVETDHSLFDMPDKQSDRFGTSITLSVYRPLGEWLDTLRKELDSRCGERPKDLVAALFGSIGGSSDCGHLELVKLQSKEEAETILKMMEDKDFVVKTKVDGKEVVKVGGDHELSFKDLVVLESLPGRWREVDRIVLSG